MSSQNPRPPRRRIAGERRPSRPDAGRPEPQDTLGWVYLKKRMPTEASAAFRRALALAPNNQTYKEHAAQAEQALN